MSEPSNDVFDYTIEEINAADTSGVDEEAWREHENIETAPPEGEGTKSRRGRKHDDPDAS